MTFGSTKSNEVMTVLNEMRSGGFVFVKGYTPLHGNGEVADYYIQFGVNYGRIKDNDILDLQAVQNGTKPLNLHIKYGVWVDPQGNQHNRKAKDRSPMTVEFDIGMDDARLQAAVTKVLHHLTDPNPTTVDYTKEGKGMYSLDGDTDRVYIRDALRMFKNVTTEGDWPFKASSESVAIENAVRKTLRVGKYRQFFFEFGQFDYIIVNGAAITFDAEGEPIITDPAMVKEPVQVVAA